MQNVSDKTRRRLEIQGFVGIEDEVLSDTGRWLKLALFLCSTVAGIGTAMASPLILLALTPIAALGAIFHVHPFDLIYNLGIRNITGTRELPKRGTPSRFACGLAAVWLISTAALFLAGYTLAGYMLGGVLTCVGLLVGTTDICIPSMIFRALFGWPDRK